MIERVVFVFLLSSILQVQMQSTRTSYVFDQIAESVDRTLTCLERTPDLDVNVTFPVVSGLANLYAIGHYVQGSKVPHAKIIQGFIDRYYGFVERGLAAFPNMVDAQLLWYPNYWIITGDFRFRKGNIAKRPPSNRTLSQIYERSAGTDETIKCYLDLVNKNLGSAVLRPCYSPCEDIMSQSDLDSGPPPSQRMYYIGTENLLNCSNNSPEETYAKIQYICNYLKREVDGMFKVRETDQFQDIRYYFLNKIQFCGSYGFVEFYSRELITYIVESIGCDGCVGTSRNTFQEKQALTGLTLAILGSVIRLLAEEATTQIEPTIPGLVGIPVESSKG